MNSKLSSQAELLKALGHPTRFCIVEGLLKGACNVSKMVECLNVPQPTISQHLNVLKAAGIIKGERKATEVCYSVVDEKAKKVVALLR